VWQLFIVMFHFHFHKLWCWSQNCVEEKEIEEKERYGDYIHIV